MIIKSMSRSSMSFTQLYEYLTRDENVKLGSYNLFSDPYDKQGVVNEFMSNASYLKRSRGKNYIYHEIIALQHNHLSLELEARILQELGDYYIGLRAKDHLCFSALHRDREHTHIHLMISANAIASTERSRLSKKAFAHIQQSAEIYLSRHFPQLEATQHYQRTGEHKEKMHTKAWLTKRLHDLFECAGSERHLKTLLEAEGFTIERRGRMLRVLFEGRAYRLKTLGLEVEYNELIKEPNPTKTADEKYQEACERER